MCRKRTYINYPRHRAVRKWCSDMKARLRTCLRVADDWQVRTPKRSFAEVLQEVLAFAVGIDSDEVAAADSHSLLASSKGMPLQHFIPLHWEARDELTDGRHRDCWCKQATIGTQDAYQSQRSS